MRIFLVQSFLFWENPVANQLHFDQKLSALYGATDLVVLPEMFTTGFSMAAKNYAHGEEIIDYLSRHAVKGRFAIYASVMYKEGSTYYNRGLFVFPQGGYSYYDKRHLFTLAGEHKVYTPGKDRLVVNYLGVRILLQVCYDLRFPVFSRNRGEYDLALYVANWPLPRIQAWDALLKARAIENMAYVVGVNRVGMDGHGMVYNGHSVAYDPLGKILTLPNWEQDGVQMVEIDVHDMKTTRIKYGFLNDAD